MVYDMTVRGLAENTKKSYLYSVSGLAGHYGRSPDRISAQEVQDYLIYLHQKRGLSWMSCNCARHAIRFSTASRSVCPSRTSTRRAPRRLRPCPSSSTTTSWCGCLGVTTNRKHRAWLMTAYAAGLRASELGRLRINDIDSQRMCLRIDQGKANKDRYVPLSPRLLEELREYWRRVRPERWLFPGQFLARPMSRHGPSQVYSRAKDRAGIDKSGGIHTLRHYSRIRLIQERPTHRFREVVVAQFVAEVHDG